MNIASVIVIFVIAWWVSFFMFLPIGVRRDDNPDKGHDPGAPVKPMVWKKVLWSTLTAFAILGIYWYLSDVMGISLRPEGY